MNNKRIFVIIEYSQFIAAARGAFNTIDEADTAMKVLKNNSNTNNTSWIISSCIY